MLRKNTKNYLRIDLRVFFKTFLIIKMYITAKSDYLSLFLKVRWMAQNALGARDVLGDLRLLLQTLIDCWIA
jgi:hypothetical protein